jgi:hypothetical protein
MRLLYQYAIAIKTSVMVDLVVELQCLHGYLGRIKFQLHKAVIIGVAHHSEVCLLILLRGRINKPRRFLKLQSISTAKGFKLPIPCFKLMQFSLGIGGLLVLFDNKVSWLAFGV